MKRESTGTKIQVLAFIVLIIEVLTSVITGIAVAVENESFWMFLVIAVGGSIGSYIFYLFLQAFGELVEDTRYIANNMEERKTEPQPSVTYNSWPDSNESVVYKPQQKIKGGWTCKQCGKVNASYVGTCGCGARKTD